MSHGSVTMRHGGSVDDRIGVAEERDGLGRTCSGSETARELVPQSRRKPEANRPTGAPVPLPSLAPFFLALAVLFLQPGTLFHVPQTLESTRFLHRKISYHPRALKVPVYGCTLLQNRYTVRNEKRNAGSGGTRGKGGGSQQPRGVFAWIQRRYSPQMICLRPSRASRTTARTQSRHTNMRHGRGTGANENDDDMGYANGFRATSTHYHTVNAPAASQDVTRSPASLVD